MADQSTKSGTGSIPGTECQFSDKNYISCSRICRGFGVGRESRIEILENVDFDMERGETVAVVGASGIGKSTLLHILGTLDKPDSGEMFFAGENVFDYDEVQLAGFRNRSIGLVFQFHHLLPEFSAVENAMIPMLIGGRSRQEAAGEAESILIRMGLKNRLQNRVTDLSGGEQQRVAIARALILRPLILLADEPTGNLDIQNGRQVHRLLLELNEEFGMTMVVVTHNPELASLMARRVTIRGGQIVEAN